MLSVSCVGYIRAVSSCNQIIPGPSVDVVDSRTVEINPQEKVSSDETALRPDSS